jgi:cytochrome c oxidase assembly protein subunit 23
MSESNRKADAEYKGAAPDVSQQKDKVDFTKGPVDSYKYYPDNPTSSYHKSKFAGKGPSRYYDPCQESANMSIKCLESNNFDRDMCHEYFKAYRECKKEWLSQRRKDTRNGTGGWS